MPNVSLDSEFGEKAIYLVLSFRKQDLRFQKVMDLSESTCSQSSERENLDDQRSSSNRHLYWPLNKQPFLPLSAHKHQKSTQVGNFAMSVSEKF